MGIESITESQSNGELASLQDTLGSEQIASVETLGNEIATVITDASRLHRFEYVIGEVADYGVSSNDHAHFSLVHESGTIHCVIFDFRRATITTDIENGMQVAVTGDISFYSQDNRCSIEVEEVTSIRDDEAHQSSTALPTEHRQLLLLAVVLLSVLVIGSAIVLL